MGKNALIEPIALYGIILLSFTQLKFFNNFFWILLFSAKFLIKLWMCRQMKQFSTLVKTLTSHSHLCHKLFASSVFKHLYCIYIIMKFSSFSKKKRRQTETMWKTYDVHCRKYLKIQRGDFPFNLSCRTFFLKIKLLFITLRINQI